ncbi:unnamed protein product [Anisakis simplex]|uniref:Glycogen-binding subunit 76A (inferred by orthology to a D. melanogaster protein) n=1 Tax=Anisakis simplex TaxID=6269 RepID=A0A0M3JXW6_ANISI|nr:unnamed protein product [Anisakis simplex]
MGTMRRSYNDPPYPTTLPVQSLSPNQSVVHDLFDFTDFATLLLLFDLRTDLWHSLHRAVTSTDARQEAVRVDEQTMMIETAVATRRRVAIDCTCSRAGAATRSAAPQSTPNDTKSELILSQSPLNIYSSYTYPSTKLRNPLGLKLLITNSNHSSHPFSDSDNTHSDVNNENNGFNSPSPCSPSGHSIPSSRDSTCDSGFSSDDNSVNRKPSKKLQAVEECHSLSVVHTLIPVLLSTYIRSRHFSSRTKSLRSALRTPTSSGPQKTVRFADALGLDLEHKTVYDADDWIDDELMFSFSMFAFNPHESSKQRKHSPSTTVSLIINNWSIRSEAEVSHLTRTQCVCLKSVDVIDTNLTGIVDVLNLAPEKQVCIRYTLDDWSSYLEIHAIYMQSIGNDGAVDAFSFFVSFPANLPVGTKCQFCIRYTVNGTSHWDSNCGANYTLEYVERSADDSSYSPNNRNSNIRHRAVIKSKQDLLKPNTTTPNHQPSSYTLSKSKATYKLNGFNTNHQFDYLPNLQQIVRPSKYIGWARSGYSYDDDGFY